jgi:hypothetical protein
VIRFHVYILVDEAVQKCGLKVKLTQMQFLGFRDSQNDSHGVIRDNWCKYVIVVNPLSLLKASHDKAGPATFNVISIVAFCSIYPFCV